MASPSPRRLTTWKDIAAYIGRDARTAKRYEIERLLPVHRLPGAGRSVVYAFTEELDAWLRRGVGGEREDHDRAQPEAATAAGRLEVPPVPAPRPIFPPAVRLRPVQLVIVSSALFALILMLASPLALRAARPSAASHPSDSDAVARAAFLDGQYAWRQRTPESLRRAVDDFTQAVVRDPDYGEAYVGLADSYNLMVEFGGMAAADAYPHAEAAVKRALVLAPRSATAHRTLAFIEFWWEGRSAAAWREFETALKLDSSSAETHHWYANALAEMRDLRALKQIEMAQALDPASTAIMADKGWILTMLGRYEEAERILRTVQVVQPDFPRTYFVLSFMARCRGQDVAMLEQLKRYAALQKNQDELSIVAAGERGLASGGSPGLWRALVSREEAFNIQGRYSSFDLASDEIRLGRKARALELLAAARTQHDPAWAGLGVNPEFAPLRNEPGFRRLLLLHTPTS